MPGAPRARRRHRRGLDEGSYNGVSGTLLAGAVCARRPRSNGESAPGHLSSFESDGRTASSTDAPRAPPTHGADSAWPWARARLRGRTVRRSGARNVGRTFSTRDRLLWKNAGRASTAMQGSRPLAARGSLEEHPLSRVAGMDGGLPRARFPDRYEAHRFGPAQHIASIDLALSRPRPARTARGPALKQIGFFATRYPYSADDRSPERRDLSEPSEAHGGAACPSSPGPRPPRGLIRAFAWRSDSRLPNARARGGSSRGGSSNATRFHETQGAGCLHGSSSPRRRLARCR